MPVTFQPAVRVHWTRDFGRGPKP